MRKQIGWLVVALLSAPVVVAAADEGSTDGARKTAPAAACGGCEMKGGTKGAVAAPAGHPQGMRMMNGPRSASDRALCKKRDTDCRLNELQSDNASLEQRLRGMEKRMDEMMRQRDAGKDTATQPGSTPPAAESHQH